MRKNNRRKLADFALNKKSEEVKKHAFYIVAIEDDEQRLVGKYIIEDPYITNNYWRIAIPNGYECVWLYNHYYEFKNIHKLTNKELECLPKSRRNIEDYREEIDFLIDMVSGDFHFADDDEPVKKRNPQLEQEMKDSEQAKSDSTSARYIYWQILKGRSVGQADINKMNLCWSAYCEYRKKYGLAPVELTPTWKIEE